MGIPVSDGRLATTPGEARQAAEVLGGPVVVKAQVLTGGRGKAGGIKLAESAHEAEERAKEILGLDIRGHVVRKLWIVERSSRSSCSQRTVGWTSNRSWRSLPRRSSTSTSIRSRDFIRGKHDGSSTRRASPIRPSRSRSRRSSGSSTRPSSPSTRCSARSIRSSSRRTARSRRSTRSSPSTTTRSSGIPTSPRCATVTQPTRSRRSPARSTSPT